MGRRIAYLLPLITSLPTFKGYLTSFLQLPACLPALVIRGQEGRESYFTRE
jgi:hypothetical protein